MRPQDDFDIRTTKPNLLETVLVLLENKKKCSDSNKTKRFFFFFLILVLLEGYMCLAHPTKLKGFSYCLC